jgi:ABC-type Fe3+/spermidine/putrescine transport system ATPase subunit
MSGGVVAQEGPPAEIYQRPRTAFVADFIGKSNILPVARADAAGGLLRLALRDSEISLLAQACDGATAGQIQCCCIRPEAIEIGGQDSADANKLMGTVTKAVDLGPYTDVWVSVDAGPTLKASILSSRAAAAARGNRVSLSVPAARIQALSA